MAGIHKLKELQLERTKKPGAYGDGGGLWLIIRPGGAKYWKFRYTLKGKSREMGLGPADMGVTKARELASKWRWVKAQGLDPITERKRERSQERKDITFAEAAQLYIEKKAPEWKSKKSPQQWRNTMRDYVTPIIGELLVRDVDRGDVLRVLEPIWQIKTETAKRVRGRIEAVLDWARANNYSDPNTPNPAIWSGNLELELPAPSKIAPVKPQASMPYSQIPDFVAELQGRDGVAARAVLFTILVAARSGETRGAVWSEFDLAAAEWQIPSSRMKNGKAHTVPLSKAAMAILKSMQAYSEGEVVFPNSKGQPLSDQGLTTVLRRMDIAKETANIHGFRSSFRTWAAERASDFNANVAEMALSHYPSDDVVKAYDRSTLLKLRRKLAEKWARYVMNEKRGSVVPIAAAKN